MDGVWLASAKHSNLLGHRKSMAFCELGHSVRTYKGIRKGMTFYELVHNFLDSLLDEGKSQASPVLENI